MPIGGGVDNPGSPYTETGTVYGKGMPSGSDTYVPGAGGPMVYSDTGIVRGKGVPSGSDSLSINIWEEVGQVFGKGFASEFRPSIQIYEDTGLVFGRGLPSVRDRVIASELPGPVFGVGVPGGTDIFPTAGANVYWEFGFAFGMGLAGGSDQLVAPELATAIGKGAPSSVILAVLTDSGLANGKGVPGGPGVILLTESGRANGKGSPGSSHSVVQLEAGNARGAGRPAGSSQLIASDATKALGAGRPGGTEASMTITEMATAKGAGHAAGTSALVAVDASRASGKGSPAASGQLVGKDQGLAQGKGQPAGTDARVIIDSGHASGKGTPAGTSQLIGAESSRATGKGTPGRGIPGIDVAGLIPAVRYHAYAVFHPVGVNLFPEGLPTFTIGDTGAVDYPLVCIIASRADDRESAVNDQAQTVTIDVVVAMKEASGQDTTQVQRQLLQQLELRLLADQQLFGRTDIPSAYNTMINAAPFVRTNSYQQHFSENQQKVIVNVLSIEAWTVTNERLT